MNGVEKQE